MLEFRALTSEEFVFDKDMVTAQLQFEEPAIIVVGNPGSGAGQGGWGWRHNYGSGQGWSSEQPVPDEAYVEEKATDMLAAHVASLIVDMPDYATREYGAIVFRDQNGELKVTPLIPGPTGTQGGTVDLWPTILAVGAHNVVGVIHSHPQIQPYNGQPAPNDHILSASDATWFDWLDDNGNDGIVDQRMYLVHDNQVDEYLVDNNLDTWSTGLETNAEISDVYYL